MSFARAALRITSFLVIGLSVAVQAQTIWYVDAANCPGSGTQADPFCRIQDAINAAAANATPPDEIVVANGTYTGTGNKDIDFGGKLIRLHSLNGPANCIIDCQGGGRGFYFHRHETSASVVEGFTIRNGYVTADSPGLNLGGGVHCSTSNPTLTNCTITGNRALNTGGGVYCEYSASPTLTNCTIRGNTANSGGGLDCHYESAPTLTNCALTGNTASNGGAVSCDYSSTPTLTNCTIVGNTAALGAVMDCSASNPTLTNCTITGNKASIGGGVRSYASQPKLTNCILWGDTPAEFNNVSSMPIVTFCDVQGGFTGTGNIDVDPGFAFGDDFHLTPGSPCIDAGTNTPSGGLTAQDADGNLRPLDGNSDGQSLADMGAYEFNPTAPVIALSPPLLDVCSYDGNPDPVTRTLSIRSDNGGMLTWEVATGCSWLSADPHDGTCQQEIDPAVLTFHTAGLAVGDHSCVLAVTAPQATNSPRQMLVTLHLGAARRVPSDYSTIQSAIDAAAPYEWVLLAEGVYRGVGNRDLDFHGKLITLRSESGNPAACTIDCERRGGGFFFRTGERSGSRVEGLTIRGAGATYGAVYCSNHSSPTLVNCTFSGSAASGGGVSCDDYSSPTLIRCTITGSDGSGVACDDYSSPTLTDCIISGNMGGLGAGVYCDFYSSPTLTNCTIAGNTAAAYGGGVACYDWSAPRFTNCTISGNSAAGHGGGVVSYSSTPVLTNCVLWADTPQEIWNSNGSPILTFCDVQGGYVGTGNISVDPGFAFVDDFHLTPGSPCIDAGTNSPPGGLPAHDADGNPRPLDGTGDGLAVADMGACEFDPTAPAIALSPPMFGIVSYDGHPDPIARTLSIRSSNGRTLTWEAAASCSWLSVDPPNGNCQQEADSVTLALDTSSLAPGDYSCVVIVSAPQATNSPRQVLVTLHLGAARHVPSDYSTIQAAIDAAESLDWVLLADGLYTGVGNRDLDLQGKTITVRSVSGNPTACIIDCENSGAGFNFYSGEQSGSRIQGLTIRGASSAAIRCDNSASPAINNCIIAENRSSVGAGVCCYDHSSPTLTNCTLSGNIALFGGAVSCEYYSSPTLINCILWGDTPDEVYSRALTPILLLPTAMSRAATPAPATSTPTRSSSIRTAATSTSPPTPPASTPAIQLRITAWSPSPTAGGSTWEPMATRPRRSARAGWISWATSRSARLAWARWCLTTGSA